MISRYFFLILCSFLSFAMASATSLNLPVKVINGDSYYFYQVKGNAQVAEIAQALNIPEATIIKYNPSAKDGVKKKQLLFFPVEDFSVAENKYTAATPNKVMHSVRKGQTLYGISKTYNVSIDDLVAANPSAVNGLHEGDLIEIPTRNTVTTPSTPTTPNSSTPIYHTIQKGESMYGVAKRYNTTIEKLLETNPGIYPNHFNVGDVVKIYPNTSTNITIQKDIKQMVAYSAQKGETFESIAAANKVSVEELKQANPDLKKIKKGSILYIPQNGTSTETVNSSTVSAKELEQTYSKKIDELYANSHRTNKDGVINVAMILPFQLHNDNPPRQAYLYTDFYKGFLLAIDSIGKTVTQKKININVYDTEHNLNITDSILALPAMKTMDLIIAPSEPKQLQRCNEFGKKNSIFVINCFSSKNEDYAHNPYVIQLNMPTSYLSSAVNQLIADKFKDYEIIFLKDAASTDTEIVDDIKTFLSEHKTKTHYIDFTSTVDANTISSYMDPGSDYLFIPTSSDKKFFTTCSPIIKSVKEQRYDCNVAFLGHPEYLALKNSKETLKALDSYIYSRYFIANAKRGERIHSLFQKAYGENMIVTTPLLGIMGFDLANYIITTLANQNQIRNNYFDGVQMDVELERSSNWGGYINKCVELVHFSEDGVKESIIK